MRIKPYHKIAKVLLSLPVALSSTCYQKTLFERIIELENGSIKNIFTSEELRKKKFRVNDLWV